jgi:hypothetical protein
MSLGKLRGSQRPVCRARLRIVLIRSQLSERVEGISLRFAHGLWRNGGRLTLGSCSGASRWVLSQVANEPLVHADSWFSGGIARWYVEGVEYCLESEGPKD